MAIQKQAVDISFAKGLDTKTDPWRLQIGNFLSLVNSRFTKGGRLTKRNGFGPLATVPSDTPKYLTTLSGNLIGIGNKIDAYSAGSNTWNSRGTFQPLSFSPLSVSRSSINQTQCDMVVAPNGLLCAVYTEFNGTTSNYFYVVQDSVTGQAIVNPTAIPVASGTVTGAPRVFLLGGYFIIVFTNVITATSHLQYIAVSTSSPIVVTANTDIAANYTSATTVSWDGVVFGTRLFIAYNNTSGGQSIKVTSLNTNFVVASPTTFASSIATVMSMCVDSTNAQSPIIYAAFYDVAGTTGNVIAVDQNLHKRMSATQIISSGTVYNVTCAAQNGIVTVFYEVANTRRYDAALVFDYIKKVPVTLPNTVTTGTVGTTTQIVLSLGLASKAFIVNGTIYLLGEYCSRLQSTYFLIDSSANVYSRFAYENGSANALTTTTGYLPTGLPQAQLVDGNVYIGYLFKDLIETVNATPNSNGSGAPNISNVYSQTGVNMAIFGFNTNALTAVEIGGVLNISGGMLWNFDGQTLNEQGFHLFPDDVEVVLIADPAPTGTVANGSPTMTAVSDTTNIAVGMNISGTNVPAGTKVTGVTVNTITMSVNATGNNTGTYTFTGNITAQQYFYSVTYEWTDAVGNIIRSAPSIPVTVTASAGHTSTVVQITYLNLTYKSNVRIVIYRWSAGQEIYYQITSISSPILNVINGSPSSSSSFVDYVDLAADSSISGNNIIYTTGGVLENIPGPASNGLTLFDDRLWSIDAEDPNSIWYSKQVIEATPVEMSDLLTKFIAPSIGSAGSTGVMKAFAPMDDKIILFKKDALAYMNGTGPDNTGNNDNYSQVIPIPSSVGSSNIKSIVLIPRGLMFQSDNGIWILQRDLSVFYIGAPVEAFNSYTVTSAQQIPGTNEVRFALSNGMSLVYDYFYDQWDTDEGMPSISSTLLDGLQVVVNSSGIVSQETPGLYLDNGNPVLMNFVTSWINLAGLQGYKRAFFFYLLGQYRSPHKLNLQVAYDYNPSPVQSKLITPNNFAPFYGGSSPYGQGNYGGPGNVEQWRVFLAQQRCMSFQITMNEVYDSSLGVAAGQGLTLSGLNLVIGIKKGFRPVASSISAGGGTNRGA